MTKLSGKLIDGASQIIADAVIELRSLKNTNTILNKVISATTTEEGFYSIDAQIGKYEVVIVRSGFSPASVGIIDIYADSLDGSLNDYLLNPNENEITPEILAQVSALRDDSKKFASNAENAAKSIQDIKTSIDDAQVDVKQAAQQANDSATLAQQAKESTDTSSLLASDSAKNANQAKQEITDQISVVKQLVSKVETTAQTVSEAEDKASLSALNAKNSEQEAAKFAQQAELSASNIDLSNTLKLTGGILTGDLFINDKKVLVDGDINQFNGGTVMGDTHFTGRLRAPTVDVADSLNIDKSILTNINDKLHLNGKEILVNGSSFKYHGSLGQTDLNTLTGDQDGVYIQHDGPLPQFNYPITQAGSLVVLNTGGWLKSCVQIYNTYLGIEYRRNYNANTNNWSNWIQSYPAAQGILQSIRIFNSSGFYTPSSGISYIKVLCVAGGILYKESEGINGSYALSIYSVTQVSGGVQVVVGAGAITGTQRKTWYWSGTSSFGSLVTCSGSGVYTKTLFDNDYNYGTVSGSATFATDGSGIRPFSCDWGIGAYGNQGIVIVEEYK